MKTPKKYYPALVAVAIAAGAFIPTSFGGENGPTPKTAQSEAAKSDPVLISLKKQLMDPLQQQAKQWALMSRRAPSANTSYQLVETDSTTPKGIREFQVIQVSTPFSKKQKPTTKDYVKVRHLAGNDSLLIALKNDWVSVDKHPLLKYLPKPVKQEPGQKITP